MISVNSLGYFTCYFPHWKRKETYTDFLRNYKICEDHKMKIGILTFHKSINYGSVLQAWALQNLLLSFGYDAEIIDYEPECYEMKYGIYLPSYSLKSFVKNVLRFPIAKYRKHKSRCFADFRAKELRLSKEKYGKASDPEELEGKYDCLICGSDQIWNVHAKDCDDFFFLPNVSAKKIAYAVSINTTDYTEPRCNDEMKRWIQDFSFLSCREKTGAERIKKFINGTHEVMTMLDPTLLHDKADFDSITGPRIIQEEYIFLYKVWAGKESFSMASSVSERLKLPVYTLLLANDVLTLWKIEKQGIKVIRYDTRPEDYLSLIKNASYVMTDSFHGTAFSIIFEKNVICVKEKKQGKDIEADERIMNLLESLEMKERYISVSEIDNVLSDRLDYERITARRMKAADYCISLLKKTIEA